MDSQHVNEVSKWVSDHSDEMYSWAYYKTSNKELAEDLVQDTFLSAHSNIHKFKKDSNPKTWLFTILNNKIIDHYRSAAHRKIKNATQLSDPEYNGSFFEQNEGWNARYVTQWEEEKHLLDNPSFLKALQECLDRLPERYKAVTMAKFFHHKKGKDICQDLDISSSNLWQIVHRSKLQLKACLDTNWNHE